MIGTQKPTNGHGSWNRLRERGRRLSLISTSIHAVNNFLFRKYKAAKARIYTEIKKERFLTRLFLSHSHHLPSQSRDPVDVSRSGHLAVNLGYYLTSFNRSRIGFVSSTKLVVNLLDLLTLPRNERTS